MTNLLRDSGRAVVETSIAARTGSGRLLRIRYEEGDRALIGAARRYGVNAEVCSLWTQNYEILMSLSPTYARE